MYFQVEQIHHNGNSEKLISNFGKLTLAQQLLYSSGIFCEKAISVYLQQNWQVFKGSFAKSFC